MTRAKRIVAWGLFSLAMLVGSGLLLADRLTPPATGEPSTALPVQVDQTALDRELQPILDRHPGRTGVIMVADGLDAFAARAMSARQAGRSLDLQYYIWHDDLTGRLLGREALQAAERGVRVRVLLDDVNAGGKDEALLALDRHPNIEVRLYNPFRNRAGVRRLLEMAQRLFSLNHRMHNKQWIADGRVAVLGGRNIGAEYFSASDESNFHDLDLLLFGPAVEQSSAIFDAYWNSDAAVPMETLEEPDVDPLAQLLKAIGTEAEGAPARVYLDRVDGSRSVQDYLAQSLAPHWIERIEVVSDRPLKCLEDGVTGERLVDRIQRDLAMARRKAFVISPYFVPGDTATRNFVALAGKQVQVAIVTNSLAANDVVAVHGGYAGYRPTLLAGGVHLYEIRARKGPGQDSDGDGRADAPPPAGQVSTDDGRVDGAPRAGGTTGERLAATGAGGEGGRGGGGGLGSGSGGGDGSSGVGSGAGSSSGASLHTKAYLVDDRIGFVGSFNMDPRSATLNTEMGVFFDHPGLAAELNREFLHLAGPRLSYWVWLMDGDLRWLDRATTPPRLYTREPEADAWQRAQAAVMRWLPIESQL
ncbi:MAG TPA: phospholipase D family protein [Luteimonas sp.]|nr:phospholipase D family protein [Luteimonas sp.]